VVERINGETFGGGEQTTYRCQIHSNYNFSPTKNLLTLCQERKTMKEQEMKEYRILFNNPQLTPVCIEADDYQFKQENGSNILEFWIGDEVTAVFLPSEIRGFVVLFCGLPGKQKECCETS
jgi:hypothetical protein